MSGGSWLAVGLVGLVFLALLAAFAGAGGVTVTTETSDPGPYAMNITPGAGGAVTGKDSHGGRSLFGITFTSDKHTLSVMFVPPPGCADKPQTSERLVAEGDCIGALAEGPISGIGLTPAGDALVVVDISVSEECFAVTAIASAWPSSNEECSE